CNALSFARLAPADASMSAVRNQWLPFRVLPDLCLPALSLFPGQSAAQLARWAAGGNAHVLADLRDDYFGRPPVDAGNAIQAGQLVGKRGEMPLDFRAERADRF